MINGLCTTFQSTCNIYFVISLSFNLVCSAGAGYVDGLVQERRNSSALAMELRLSCSNPLMYDSYVAGLVQKTSNSSVCKQCLKMHWRCNSQGIIWHSFGLLNDDWISHPRVFCGNLYRPKMPNHSALDLMWVTPWDVITYPCPWMHVSMHYTKCMGTCIQGHG